MGRDLPDRPSGHPEGKNVGKTGGTGATQRGHILAKTPMFTGHFDDPLGWARRAVVRFLNPAIVGVIVVSIARLASAQDGAGAITDAPRPGPAAPVATPVPAVPVNEALRLDEYLNRLEEWRNEGRITAA